MEEKKERKIEESPLTGKKYAWTLIATDVYVYLLTSLRMLCQKEGRKCRIKTGSYCHFKHFSIYLV